VGKIQRKNQSGQAIIEYIILLTFTVGIVVAFMSKSTSLFDKATVAVGGKMEKQLRTGKAPASIWTK
jgi:hypothetical protein